VEVKTLTPMIPLSFMVLSRYAFVIVFEKVTYSGETYILCHKSLSKFKSQIKYYTHLLDFMMFGHQTLKETVFDPVDIKISR